MTVFSWSDILLIVIRAHGSHSGGTQGQAADVVVDDGEEAAHNGASDQVQVHAGAEGEPEEEGQEVHGLGHHLLQQDGHAHGGKQRAHGEERLHGQPVHGQVVLDELDHTGAEVAHDEGGDEGAEEVGDPGEDHVNQIQLFQLAPLDPLQAHVLPDQVDGGGAVEEDGSHGAHGGGHGDREALGLGGGGVQPHGGDVQHGKGNADVGDGAHVGGHGAAGGHQGDVHNLHRSAQHDAHGDIPQNQAADQAADEGAAQGVVSEGGAAQARHGG